MKITDEMVNAADSVLSRVRPGINDGQIRLALEAAFAVRVKYTREQINEMIGRGEMFVDINPEADWIAAAEMACPHCGGSGHKDDVRPLSASPVGVVKPLEWRPITSPREDGPPEPTGDIEANTMIGEYSVCFDEDETVADTPWCCWSPIECIGHFPDFEEAKSTAFADYSARIMSAIEPAGVGVETREAITSAYLGLKVLKTMCRKAGLGGGVEATESAMKQLVSVMPELPALSALRVPAALKGDEQ